MSTAEDFVKGMEALIARPEARPWTPDEELAWALERGYVVERNGRYVITEAGENAPERTKARPVGEAE